MAPLGSSMKFPSIKPSTEKKSEKVIETTIIDFKLRETLSATTPGMRRRVLTTTVPISLIEAETVIPSKM